jgi:hypothetical protein
MFESVAVLAPVLITLFSVTFKRLGAVDDQIQKLQLQALEKYVTKADLALQFERLGKQIDKLEHKLDAVYRVESDRDYLLRKYQHDIHDND